MKDINKILEERKKTHGPYDEFASCWLDLQGVIQKYKGMGELSDKQLVSLSMVTNKMARILTGDPSHDDHWDDIAGYAILGKKENEAV